LRDSDFRDIQRRARNLRSLITKHQRKLISVNAFGDELVVIHVRNSMSIEGQSIAIDAVVVWRIVNGKIAEAWDIPSAHTMADSP